ncbi:MAG: hypothetical protein IPP60_01930 [Sphingobacteriales bacterium]|nr:hypothetical protein [Sphingobacteriales bacterium]MBP8192334.1 hypothetical protein [Chitinophagales bacterium]MCC6584319.1 hypothetical protein [Chitinophagales bacterium]
MYLRFTTKNIDEETGLEKGIFSILNELYDSNELHDYEQKTIKEVVSWFNKNLPVPDKFSKKKNAAHVAPRGIAWFKDSATEMIEKMYELKNYLENHEVEVIVLKAKRIGYIIYEDEFQAIAEPFNKELKSLLKQ